jgi:hypothetical protein
MLMGARRLARVAVVWVCVVAGLLVSGGVAGAAVVHHFLPEASAKLSEGVPVEGPHGEAVPLPGALQGVNAVSLDGGDLFVAERFGAGSGGYRLDEFDASSGAFVSQFAQVPSLSYLYQGVAVGHSTGAGEVYVGGDELVEGAPRGRVAVFDAAGVLQGVWTGADTATPGGFGCFECGGHGDVAVDESGSLSWAAGDVYVADPENGVVDVFKPLAGGGEESVAVLPGVEPGVPFAHPSSVAVNQSNDEVLVADERGVDVFRPAAISGQFEFVSALTEVPGGSLGSVSGVAVDSGNDDVYVTEGELGVVDQFDAAGGFMGRLTGTPAGPFGLLAGVVVDPGSHRVYVGDRNNETGVGAVDVFGGSLVVPEVVTEPVSGLKARGATLDGVVNPGGVQLTSCSFEYGTSTAYGQSAACVPAAGSIPADSSEHAVSADIVGLAADTTYHFRLRAGNENGVSSGSDQEFTTLGPGLHETSSSNVGSASATLNANIDPNNAATTYYFQYGTSAGYGSETPVPAGVVGSGKGDVEVSQHVQGLISGTVYHYRVVVLSEPAAGEPFMEAGPDETFTTQGAVGGGGLLDGRAWEMVSPPDKHGALVEPIGDGKVTQAAANGGAVSYLTDAPIEGEPQGYANGVQVLSTRGAGGWTSRDIAIPHDTTTTIAVIGEEYRFFSSDLSLAVVQPYGGFTPSLSAEASEQTAFQRTLYRNGNVNDSCSSACFRPLATGKPGFANVPLGTVFGEEGQCPPSEGCGPRFVGATPDVSHIVVRSRVALTSTPIGAASLYEWSDGRLVLVSVLPGGEPAGFEAQLGAEDAVARHAISDDGSRVIWSSRSDGRLFMRDVVRGETVQLDAAQGGTASGLPAASFQFASGDGSRVFFEDKQSLTGDSGARDKGLGDDSYDLYECEMRVVAGKLGCRLTDLTPLGVSGERAGVLGLMPGASEDGSWLYFVAEGALAPGAVPGRCRKNAGVCNLYVRHDGVTKLVAVISSEAQDGHDFGSRGGLMGLTARVSPDGRWLAFMSQRALTGYDNRDAVSGEPDEEVYLYDGVSGRLVCASCNPSGARPVGVEVGKMLGGIDGGQVFGPSMWLAGSVPAWTGYENALNIALYQSRYLSDSGRLFFNSNDALVPGDVNGTGDVYEYEPPGVGDCTAGGASFSVRSGGCVGLVSSGTSGEESGFLDASESGGDVFFFTNAQLSGSDLDSSRDVYDAHECSSVAPCLASAVSSPPPCSTSDACRLALPPAPSLLGSPSSATFAGAGNIPAPGVASGARPKSLSRAQQFARALKACHAKKNRKRRVACERAARKRFAARRSTARRSVARRSARTGVVGRGVVSIRGEG